MIIAGTGHRPDKLGGYSEAAYNKLYRFAEAKLLQYKPKEVISGMALGWDQALAHAAIILKIPFQAAIPFASQETSWPEASRERYHRLLAHATVKAFVCEPRYAAWKMQRRNEWMVRHANSTGATLSL